MTVSGRGEGIRRYSARGRVMLFKAIAEQDGGDLSLWHGDEPSTPDQERKLMGRFGMERA